MGEPMTHVVDTCVRDRHVGFNFGNSVSSHLSMEYVRGYQYGGCTTPLGFDCSTSFRPAPGHFTRFLLRIDETLQCRCKIHVL